MNNPDNVQPSDEIRTIEDTWLVQEFSKRYSQEEVEEAVEQIWQSLLVVKADYIAAETKKARVDELQKLDASDVHMSITGKTMLQQSIEDRIAELQKETEPDD